MPLHDFLSPEQIATLRAAFDRLIPADEFPGAWENGAGDYLAGQFARDLKDYIELYRLGLDSLNEEAKVRHNASFVELPQGAQDELLAAIERGETQFEWPVKPRLFFDALLNHSAEGYYADAGNGGNEEKASWQMIGFLDR
jgi:hypothetical protein